MKRIRIIAKTDLLLVLEALANNRRDLSYRNQFMYVLRKGFASVYLVCLMSYRSTLHGTSAPDSGVLTTYTMTYIRFVSSPFSDVDRHVTPNDQSVISSTNTANQYQENEDHWYTYCG